MTEKDSTLNIHRNARARAAALAATSELSTTPTGTVQYQSRGLVAVIGGEQAQWFVNRIQQPLQAQLILTEGEETPGKPTIPVGRRDLRIEGYLGNFTIELGEAGKPNHDVVRVDMIADLSEKPLLQQKLPPPGYWHSGTEPQDQDALLLTLGEMIGTFEKPRYFNYLPHLCAHSRAGQPGCDRCIKSCPAEAIISIGERVEVNPNLCQGGGICASVCPSGAMNYAYPGPADTLKRLYLLLKHYRETGGQDPVVLFAAEADAVELQALPANVLLIAVEELASVGMEVWASALAWGARHVVLVDGGSIPDTVYDVLDQELTTLGYLLSGLGYPANVLCLVDLPNAEQECCASMPAIPPASFAAQSGKRQQLAAALDHLRTHSDAVQPVIALPEGAAYGRVLVDTGRCNLCLSCTSVCPANALKGADDQPGLLFQENLCLQCGICVNACPEQALTLEARFLSDTKARATPALLHEEPPFCCISCGKPFATSKVINNIMSKLTGHAMFQGERAMRRLQMCEDCRVVDAVQDPQAMSEGIASAQVKSNQRKPS